MLCSVAREIASVFVTFIRLWRIRVIVAVLMVILLSLFIVMSIFVWVSVGASLMSSFIIVIWRFLFCRCLIVSVLSFGSISAIILLIFVFLAIVLAVVGLFSVNIIRRYFVLCRRCSVVTLLLRNGSRIVSRVIVFSLIVSSIGVVFCDVWVVIFVSIVLVLICCLFNSVWLFSNNVWFLVLSFTFSSRNVRKSLICGSCILFVLSRIVRVSGWLEFCFSVVVRRNVCVLLILVNVFIAIICGFFLVSVSVLSNIIVSSVLARCSALAFRISTLNLVVRSTSEIIDIGVVSFSVYG